MTEPTTPPAAFGAAAVYRLRGILYADRTEAWEQVLRHRRALEDYFEPLRLRLFVDEPEGYAYLRQAETEADDNFPRLMSRRNLSYYQTVLLVLLRGRLLAFEDAGGPGSLTLTVEDMVEMMRVYWDELDTNERKREEAVGTAINKLHKYGFLSKLKGERGRYAVRRIIKAYLPITELQTVYDTLQDHHRRRHGGVREEE